VPVAFVNLFAFMINRKLLEVLVRLSAEEHRKLRLFIQSPYYYQQLWRSVSDILRFYDYIMEHGADEQNPALDKAVASAVFFPDKAFREKEKGPIDAIASDLFGLVRYFLHTNEADNKQQEIKSQLSLLRFYRKFGMEDRFVQTEQNIRKMLDAYPYHDATYFNLCLSLAEEVFCNSSILTHAALETESLQVHYNLDMYYTLRKLDYMSAMQTQGLLIEQSDTPLRSKLLNDAVMEFAKDTQNPGTQLFLKVEQLNKNPDDFALLETFGEMLQTYEHNLSLDLYSSLATHYRNFYARHYIKSGNPELQKQLFSLLKAHLGKGLLYYEGYLHVANLLMLTAHALKLGQTAFIKQVLEQHPPERLCGTRFPKEACDLNWAEYHFYLKNYDKAADYLVYKPFEHPMLGVLAEGLLVKIYFETGNELLSTRLRALDQKVRRGKLARETKQRYYNFVRLLDKLERYRWPGPSKKLLSLSEEIKNTPNVLHRDWLLEKVTQVLQS
jgi:hypothetical protein